MAAKKFNISVSDPSKFSAVLSRCRKAGLKVTQELDVLGVISGSADESKAEKIRQIPGVASVEEDRDVHSY
jgi:Peptidase inhibitor I9